jgi:hypothetical protein
MPRVKKVPQRICVGCQQTRGKKELIRIVRTPDLQVRIDTSGKLSGRGAYICRDPGCLALALSGKKLQRALHIDLPPEVVRDLQSLVEQSQVAAPAPKSGDGIQKPGVRIIRSRGSG